MDLQEYYMRHVPEYYDDMYKDGFTPMEIKFAHERMMYREIEERRQQNEFPMGLKLTSEITVK